MIFLNEKVSEVTLQWEKKEKKKKMKEETLEKRPLW